jgi:hypothetical protein
MKRHIASLKAFTAVVDHQMMVMFWGFVPCSGKISGEKNAASIFTVTEFIWLDAAVIRSKSSYTVDNVSSPFFGIEPNQFSQPEYGGSLLFSETSENLTTTWCKRPKECHHMKLFVMMYPAGLISMKRLS